MCFPCYFSHVSIFPPNATVSQNLFPMPCPPSWPYCSEACLAWDCTGGVAHPHGQATQPGHTARFFPPKNPPKRRIRNRVGALQNIQFFLQKNLYYLSNFYWGIRVNTRFDSSPKNPSNCHANLFLIWCPRHHTPPLWLHVPPGPLTRRFLMCPTWLPFFEPPILHHTSPRHLGGLVEIAVLFWFWKSWFFCTSPKGRSNGGGWPQGGLISKENTPLLLCGGGIFFQFVCNYKCYG